MCYTLYKPRHIKIRYVHVTVGKVGWELIHSFRPSSSHFFRKPGHSNTKKKFNSFFSTKKMSNHKSNTNRACHSISISFADDGKAIIAWWKKQKENVLVMWQWDDSSNDDVDNRCFHLTADVATTSTPTTRSEDGCPRCCIGLCGDKSHTEYARIRIITIIRMTAANITSSSSTSAMITLTILSWSFLPVSYKLQLERKAAVPSSIDYFPFRLDPD